MSVAYLGPPGTFSHLGAIARFGADPTFLPVDTLADVFRVVSTGQAERGLVPVENARGGSVAETLQGLCDARPTVTGEVLVGIHHQLLAHGQLGRISQIHSKPEVFAQCRQWLAKNLPSAELIATASTSAAARQIDDQRQAAIASSLAGKLYDVPVRAADIEDDPDNVTRFLVIGGQPAGATGQDKTAILFTTRHEPGALVSVLAVFADAGINLTHIDKRPAPGRHWHYKFLIEAQGHREQMADTIETTRQHCTELVVLGSFAEGC